MCQIETHFVITGVFLNIQVYEFVTCDNFISHNFHLYSFGYYIYVIACGVFRQTIVSGQLN